MHRYELKLRWTGNLGEGTSGYREYSRDYVIECADKPPLAGSSDPMFRGDVRRWNPEELLLASLSACHKLWYLHLCADAGIVVTAYEDTATASMGPDTDGTTRILAATLHPEVTLAAGNNRERAIELHSAANTECFIAQSVRFPVSHEVTVHVQSS